MKPLRSPSRRDFFRIAAAGSAAYGLPIPAALAQPRATPASPSYGFLAPAEARFIEAAVARLIPKDELGPGALEAGVPAYIDRQLGGAWGAGERLYRAGPWREAPETLGYQLPFTPAELFRHAMRAIESDLAPRVFEKLAPEEQDRYLAALEKGEVKLSPVPAKTFFDALLDATMEGFFCDPAHGGNVGMVGWRLVGFPGAYSNYYDVVDRHGVAFKVEPVSLAEHSHAPSPRPSSQGEGEGSGRRVVR